MANTTRPSVNEQHQQAEELERARIETAGDLASPPRLHADASTGRKTGATRGTEGGLLAGDQVKKLYEVLPDWSKDDLRRIAIVAPGTALSVGDIYLDLLFRERGELVAQGFETVHEELLASKKDTDYLIWDRLLNGAPRAHSDSNPSSA